MNYFCRLYKMLSIHHRYYIKFIMTKEDFVRSKFVGLFIFKSLFIIALIGKIAGYGSGPKVDRKFMFIMIFMTIAIAFNFIAKKCQKNENKIEIKLSNEQISKYVRIWEVLAYGSIFILLFVIALIDKINDLNR